MKHFKRAAAMLLAVVLSLCLAVTAFADNTDQPTGTLRVTGSGLYNPGDGAGKGKNVTAIRMFTARVTGDATADPAQKNEFDSYVLEKKWEDFFKQAEIFSAMKNASVIGSDVEATAITADELSNAAVAYLKTLQNDKSNKGTLADFAHKAQKWVRSDEHKDDFTNNVLKFTATATPVSGDTDKTKGTATFSGLTAGYYLVFPEGGSTGKNSRGTDAILVNVPKNGGVTEQTIKSTFPTVDKQVSNNKTDYKDNTTAQVGDTVTFKLTAKVPDMTDYKAYKFVFHDTLSNGLAYDENSVQVTIGGALVTKGTDYTVTEPTEDSKELTVTFADLTKVTSATVGQDIIVTYTAKITKDAVKDNPATNKVYLEYSNDPSGKGTGTSNPDESKVYTYDIKIDKFYKENSAEKPLANATFKLTTDAEGNSVVKLVQETDANTYHVQGDGEAGSVDTVTTDATGKITIKGLKDGTYYLHETIAPTGYNKLKEPIEIVITPDTKDLSQFTYKVNGKDNTPNDTTIKVENVKGVMLPETGSIGTIGLTALGVAVVLLGVFAPRKKKKENQ